MQRVIYLISASIGNFMLAGYFLQALLFPTDHIEFIYSAGFGIYILEIVNLHSTGMIMGTAGIKNRLDRVLHKISYPFFYALFYIMAFQVTKNYDVVIIAVISFASKLLFRQALPKKSSVIIISGVLLTVFSLIVMQFNGFVKELFPFPEEVYMAKPPNQSGLFVEVPQVLLFWGVMYYFSLVVVQIVMYLKAEKPQGKISI